MGCTMDAVVSLGVASTASSSAASIQERISDSNVIQNARQGAVSALSVASERVQGAASLAMDPCRLWRFVAMFSSGLFLVLFSLNFWNMPKAFAFLATIGSEQISQRRKLPYAIAYVTGLLGTLCFTLIWPRHILTAFFGVVQLVSLLYFICAHFPGGTATLNMLGRFGGRSARSLIVG
eukprot:s4778_g7.t1